MPKPTQQQQLAALAQAEAALHLATVKRHKEPRNNEWRMEQAALQTTVQALRDQLVRGSRAKKRPRRHVTHPKTDVATTAIARIVAALGS